MDPLAIRNPPELVAARTAHIHAAMLRERPRLVKGNFEVIAADDLQRLFERTDEGFFAGGLAGLVAEKADGPVTFRLSRRMTRARGHTARRRARGGGRPRRDRYEIVIASNMLLMTFAGVDRAVTACGLRCRDRLEALQRIMEHEIVHLVEMLIWGRSSCSAARFQALATNIFGHTGSTHDLVTPREHAAVTHDVRLGGTVEFELKGARLVGRVNRIHRRATVLVEADDGRPYSDGKSYHTYYVPLPMLRPAEK